MLTVHWDDYTDVGGRFFDVYETENGVVIHFIDSRELAPVGKYVGHGMAGIGLSGKYLVARYFHPLLEGIIKERFPGREVEFF